MQWSPRTGQPVLLALGAVLLAGAALGADPVGRALLGAAALLLAALALRDVLLRPRLAVDADGAVVRTLGGRVAVGWPRLRATVRTTRRLGTRSRTLELEDTGDDAVLLVLGRWDLGADPEEVAAVLWARGATGL
ncbi:PH domain-containing protein [Modestobacter sp. I12A-02628]|uniref:PH domain-containing protein n=1 Tax=Goekera deserti TaxID=2497753 RepID=A0A7K3WFK6_9ACTN|nr:PH domain-containing protein [Goekera deserti]MPR00117.1 PH domain-containing protein [Goekera deserti]NDI49896.1 PH domain-containing protein [Goekera deserti]NEL55258.1 PH domain-containing protein [Goekera deserti]